MSQVAEMIGALKPLFDACEAINADRENTIWVSTCGCNAEGEEHEGFCPICHDCTTFEEVEA